MILTVLSALFLGEKVGWRRMLAVSFGFVGAMIVVRPSYDVFGPDSLLPMLAAFLFACYLMLTSKLSRSDHILTMQFWSGLVGVVSLSLVLAISERKKNRSLLVSGSVNYPMRNVRKRIGAVAAVIFNGCTVVAAMIYILLKS